MLVSDGTEFKQVVKGKNFMTPRIKGYYQSGNYQCELSQGYGFDNEMIYGVTAVNTETMQHAYDLSRVFGTRKMALDFINKLGKM